MWQPDWAGERIIASIIVGACTLTAALIRAFVYLRTTDAPVAKTGKRRGPRKKRVRRLTTALIAIGAMTSTGLVLIDFAEAPGGSTTRPAIAASAVRGESADAMPADTLDPDARTRRFAGWLRTEGTVIYYRFADLLPNACGNGAVAVGSWDGGLEDGVPARCVSGEWLALDVAPLLHDGRLVHNITYCLGFRDSTGAWGRHSDAEAPGFHTIAVPASRMPFGRAIGFRVVRDAPLERVILTKAFPRASC